MANETQTSKRTKQNYTKSGKLQARRDQRYFDAVGRAKAYANAVEKKLEKDIKNPEILAEFARALKALKAVTRKEDRK